MKFYKCSKCKTIYAFPTALTQDYYCKKCGPESALMPLEPKWISKYTIKYKLGAIECEPLYMHLIRVKEPLTFTFTYFCPICFKELKLPLGRYTCRNCLKLMERKLSFKRNMIEDACNRCYHKNICEEKDVICHALKREYAEIGLDFNEDIDFAERYGWRAWRALLYDKPAETV